MQLKKIVTVGPESTGKSTLCEELSAHFNTAWCPEFARSYLTEHGMNYSFEDLLTIAKGQVDLEEKLSAKFLNHQTSHSSNANNSLPFFIDTDMYVMKVWCEFVFGKCHQWILDQIVSRKYDLYLLCSTDLPWAPDVLREYPDLESREKLFHIYKDILINQNVPWIEVTGNHEERLKKAIKAASELGLL
ncbi:MAG: ATP-binding protein [Bacteroidetes bacterium]|nr:ATP-binding protein [Bacteroidota bacterium]